MSHFALCAPHQIALLRGEHAVAETLRSAVETLEKDKAQLQNRVLSLEQRLAGEPTAGGDKTPTGQTASTTEKQMVSLNVQ